jgi:osmotically-inducible protein OsmY
MAEPGQSKSDGELQRDVLRELAWDPRVEQAEIGVEVRHGVVTLSGTVSSWGKRAAAEEAAYRVAGVLDVANDVQVKVPGGLVRTDAEIAGAVRHALTWDVFVPDQRIRSSVTDGWVTLDGEVDFLAEREDAERAVRNLVGVRGVTNRIAVAVTPPREVPADVRRAIEEALARRASRQASRIRVDVAGGRVTLSGRVRSWEERRAVLGAARLTPGVESVEDRLEIDHFA